MGKAGSWLALGVSAESKGMKGLDIGMIRWTTVGGWVGGWGGWVGLGGFG